MGFASAGVGHRTPVATLPASGAQRQRLIQERSCSSHDTNFRKVRNFQLKKVRNSQLKLTVTFHARFALRRAIATLTGVALWSGNGELFRACRTHFSLDGSSKTVASFIQKSTQGPCLTRTVSQEFSTLESIPRRGKKRMFPWCRLGWQWQHGPKRRDSYGQDS